jgi:anaerobic ribonucleoside-triphosphate reductase activating protein
MRFMDDPKTILDRAFPSSPLSPSATTSFNNSSSRIVPGRTRSWIRETQTLMNTLDQTINIADRIRSTQAEGPGNRFALWVQGCPMRCVGCCNPRMLEFREVELVTVRSLLDKVLSVNDIEGITFVGGEPFSQADALATLSTELARHDLSTMVFSGFTLDQIKQADRADWNALLAATDLLVDGQYVQQQHTNDRRWIGSANQRAHFFTDRYRHMSAEQEGWDPGRNTIELRLVNGQIQINGFPHQDITSQLNDTRRDNRD